MVKDLSKEISQQIMHGLCPWQASMRLLCPENKSSVSPLPQDSRTLTMHAASQLYRGALPRRHAPHTGCPVAGHWAKASTPAERSGPVHCECCALVQAEPLCFPLAENCIHPDDLFSRGGSVGPPPAPRHHRPVGGLRTGATAPGAQEHTHQCLCLCQVITMLLDEPLTLLLVVSPRTARAPRDGRECSPRCDQAPEAPRQPQFTFHHIMGEIVW